MRLLLSDCKRNKTRTHLNYSQLRLQVGFKAVVVVQVKILLRNQEASHNETLSPNLRHYGPDRAVVGSSVRRTSKFSRRCTATTAATDGNDGNEQHYHDRHSGNCQSDRLRLPAGV